MSCVGGAMGRGSRAWTRSATFPVPTIQRPTWAARQALDRLLALIHGLKSVDRQVALLYLEDLDAAAIGEVTGLSPGAVAVRIHRLKAILAVRFHDRRPS